MQFRGYNYILYGTIRSLVRQRMAQLTKISPKVCAMPDDRHENLYIEVELPGVDKEDIFLTMHADSFMIKAKKENMEYSGSYTVCCPIEYEQAKAKYKNGLLTINVPYKKPVMKGKTIPIEER